MHIIPIHSFGTNVNEFRVLLFAIVVYYTIKWVLGIVATHYRKNINELFRTLRSIWALENFTLLTANEKFALSIPYSKAKDRLKYLPFF